jgi:hypothetical protein
MTLLSFNGIRNSERENKLKKRQKSRNKEKTSEMNLIERDREQEVKTDRKG